MVRIQLDTGYLDVKAGTAFPLNLSVGDIRDISKRTGIFSKTITLEGTDNNNKLLNHYYDVNIVEGTFNINTLTKCQVVENGQPILENAYIQLVEIVKSQTTDAHNQSVTYKVLVKDSTSELFTKIGNKELADIDMNALIATTSYTAANVVTSFSHDITDVYKFLMPYDTDNLYNVRAFHPAIYAKLYFDKIFEAAGFTYEWGNLTPSSGTTSDSNYFEKLLIPYNGATPKINRESYFVEASKTAYTTAQTGNNWSEQIVSWTEDLDAESIFDPTNGDYSVPFWCQNPENITVRFTVNYDVDLINNYAGTIYKGTASQGVINKMTVLEQGTTNEPLYIFGTAGTAPTYATLSTNSLVSGATRTFEIPVTNLSNTDTLEIYVKSSLSLYYEEAGLINVADVDLDITFNTIDIEIMPSSDTLGYNTDIDLNIYIPDKIKQSDFVKSIFQMYNLFPEPDATQPNKIILKHRDDYYDDGAEKDWTTKLAKDKAQALRFLPELSKKKQVLTYKDDKDNANTVYKEATKETYGQLEYTFENEYIKGIDRKELIFSPTPITASTFGAILPIISYDPNINVRILIDGGTQTTDEFDIYNYYTGSTGVGSTAQTTAPLITHFDDPINPSFDLNFGVCDYYFYNEFNSKTNNNLYNNYWRRTIGQIDKGKMLTAYFDLRESDIQTLDLSDKIRIDNSWWNINKVIDYNANKRQLTKVELLSVDDEIKLTPYANTPTYPPHTTNPIRPVRPVKPTKPETVKPVKDVIEANIRSKNLFNQHQKTWISGINNEINSDVKAAVVIGDSKIIDNDGVYAPTIEAYEELILPDGTIITAGAELNDNFANTDLTFDGNRVHDVNGNTLGISMDGATYAEEWFYLGGGFAQMGFDTIFFEATTTEAKIQWRGVNRISVVGAETVINTQGGNYDFRVEGNTDANLIFADASTDFVGVGTATPDAKFNVLTDNAQTMIGHFQGTYAGYQWLRVERVGQATIDLAAGAGINGGGLVSSDALRFSTNGASLTNASMYIETDGKVGIGTTSPSHELDVNGTIRAYQDDRANGAEIHITNTAEATGAWVDGDIIGTLDFKITDVSASEKVRSRIQVVTVDAPPTGGNYPAYVDLTFSVTSVNTLSEAMRIQNDGNVGIGTTSPSYKLDVNGDVNVASGSAYYHNGTAGLSATYNFGGGSSGDIATMTFNGGILTAVTTVP